jgi:hypothetical protein
MKESCGTIRDDKSFDNRLTVGNFMFMKGSMEELKLCYILDESQIFDCNRRFVIKKSLNQN